MDKLALKQKLQKPSPVLLNLLFQSLDQNNQRMFLDEKQVRQEQQEVQ